MNKQNQTQIEIIWCVFGGLHHQHKKCYKSERQFSEFFAKIVLFRKIFAILELIRNYLDKIG